MTDKVQKIKEWISKEQDGLMDAQGNFEYPEHEGAYHILCNLDAYIDSLQEEFVSDFLNTESMIESYKQRLISQANGLKNSPLINMCLASYKHGINETLDTLKLSNLVRIGKNLEEEVGNYIKINGYDGLDSREEVKYIANHFAKWQKENLWKPADGDDLPEIDREVVAFQEAFPTDVDVPSLLKVVIAHRPNPKGYDGKSVTTGKVEHYTPMTYDKGGWNIPDVKYWLDCSIPKEIEL